MTYSKDGRWWYGGPLEIVGLCRDLPRTSVPQTQDPRKQKSAPGAAEKEKPKHER